MKKVLILSLLVLLSGISLVPFSTSEAGDSQDIVPGNVEMESISGVLRSIQIKPYRIIMDFPELVFSWKPVYTKFLDREDNRLSGGQFLNQYRDRGIGVWLDEEGIAKFVRPLDF